MRNLFLSFLIVFTCGMITTSFAQETVVKPKLIALKFHADWCGSCKAMGPVFSDLQNKLDGKPVLFYQLDFTNNTTKHQAYLMASALDVDSVVKANPGTGFILLIDAKSKKVLQKFTKEDDLKTIVTAIGNKL